MFAVLADETLAGLIPHIGGDAGAEAVRTDFNRHRSPPSPRMQVVDVTVSTAWPRAGQGGDSFVTLVYVAVQSIGYL